MATGREGLRRAGLMALACAALVGCGGGAALATEPVRPGLVASEPGAVGPATAAVAQAPEHGIAPQDAAPGAEAPVLAVNRFLDAASQRDHAAMAALFGTAGGPIGDQGGAFGCGLRRVGSWVGLGDRCLDWAAIELRMDVMARLLAHDAYRVVRSEGVAGRAAPSFLVEVAVTPKGGEAAQVPFVVIQAKGGRWLVAEVGLGRLAG